MLPNEILLSILKLFFRKKLFSVDYDMIYVAWVLRTFFLINTTFCIEVATCIPLPFQFQRDQYGSVTRSRQKRDWSTKAFWNNQLIHTSVYPILWAWKYEIFIRNIDSNYHILKCIDIPIYYFLEKRTQKLMRKDKWYAHVMDIKDKIKKHHLLDTDKQVEMDTFMKQYYDKSVKKVEDFTSLVPCGCTFHKPTHKRRPYLHQRTCVNYQLGHEPFSNDHMLHPITKEAWSQEQWSEQLEQVLEFLG